MSEILKLVSYVVAIIRAETTALKVDAGLALAAVLAKMTPNFTFDDQMVAWAQSNQVAKDLIVKFIDQWFSMSPVNRQLPSLGAVSEDEMRTIEGAGFDAFQWLEFIRWIIELLTRLQLEMSDPRIVGTVSAINGDTVELTPDGGSPNYWHSVPPTASITINDTQAAVKDFLPGDRILLLGDPAALVQITRMIHGRNVESAPVKKKAKPQVATPIPGAPSTSVKGPIVEEE